MRQRPRVGTGWRATGSWEGGGVRDRAVPHGSLVPNDGHAPRRVTPGTAASRRPSAPAPTGVPPRRRRPYLAGRSRPTPPGAHCSPDTAAAARTSPDDGMASTRHRILPSPPPRDAGPAAAQVRRPPVLAQCGSALPAARAAAPGGQPVTPCASGGRPPSSRTRSRCIAIVTERSRTADRDAGQPERPQLRPVRARPRRGARCRPACPPCRRPARRCR